MTSEELGKMVATLIAEVAVPIRTSVVVLDDRIKGLRESVERLAPELTAMRERLAVLETERTHFRERVLELEAQVAARERAAMR